MDTIPPIEIPPSPQVDDRVMLEGPHSRSREMWLIYRVVKDFVQGFRTMHFVGPCVSWAATSGRGSRVWDSP